MSEYFQPILESVRVGHIIHPGEDYQSAVHFDELEGRAEPRWKHHVIVTDIHAIELVRALLVEREEHINRIAELEGQVRSADERARIVAAVGDGPKSVPAVIPAQDSGEALVGVECYVWDSNFSPRETARIQAFEADCAYQYRVHGCGFRHARPIALGRFE